MLYRSLPEKPHCTLIPYLIYWGTNIYVLPLDQHPPKISSSPHHTTTYIKKKKVLTKKTKYETRYPTTPLSSSPSSQPPLFHPPSPLPPTPPTATTHCRFSPNSQWNPLQHTSLLDAKSQPSTLRSRLALSLWSFRNSNCQSHRKHRFRRFSLYRSQFDCFDGESDYAWYVRHI